VATLPVLPSVSRLEPDRVRQALASGLGDRWFQRTFQRNSPGLAPLHCRPSLRTAGLVDSSGRALFRINVIRSRQFLTDGPWQTRFGGTFPWSDEALLLIELAEKEGVAGPTILEVGTGCGHALLGLDGGGVKRLGIDRSERAVAFSRFNAQLNDLPASIDTRDIRRGLPLRWMPVLKRPALVVANLPFAVTPKDLAYPQFSDGGESGLTEFEELIRALVRYGGRGLHALLLTYSLGRVQGYRQAWDVPMRLARILPTRALEWRLLVGHQMWRINGVKRFDNPMPLRQLPSKAECRLTFSEDERARAKREFSMLAERLSTDGWSHVGYGVVSGRV
jgi:hypothetical protein